MGTKLVIFLINTMHSRWLLIDHKAADKAEHKAEAEGGHNLVVEGSLVEGSLVEEAERKAGTEEEVGSHLEVDLEIEAAHIVVVQ